VSAQSVRVKGQNQWLWFVLLVISLLALEYYGKIFERGIGHYLKWQNHKRPQLGRIWERDRENMVAQSKIESIRSVLDLQEESAESIQSFKQLFERVEPAFPLAVSRQQFLKLYYDFPGQWSERIISPYELIEIDATKKWDRVLLKRFGPWITLGFMDFQRQPIKEIFLSEETLVEVQSTRTVKRGSLEDAEFQSNRIYSVGEFLSIIATLDAETQKSVFPPPRWFLGKNYHITRVGLSESPSSPGQLTTLGIEYDSDYFTGVLLIPVPLEIANNILSQVERPEGENAGEELTTLIEPFKESP
jgi:hypothetical protein